MKGRAYHFYHHDNPLCGIWTGVPGFSYGSKGPPRIIFRCLECERLKKQAERIASKDGPTPERLLQNQIKEKTKEARAADWAEKSLLIEELRGLKNQLETLLNS